MSQASSTSSHGGAEEPVGSGKVEGPADAALFERCYAELRRIAGQRMINVPSHATLQPTALLHEAFLRVSAKPGSDSLEQRTLMLHASRAMRDILVEKARSLNALRRQGTGARLSLDDVGDSSIPLQEFGGARSGDPSADPTGRTIDLLHLEEALEGLEGAAPSAAEVVQLRYFAGLSIAEAAQVLEVSTKTVERRWELARAWLARSFQRADEPQAGGADGATSH